MRVLVIMSGADHLRLKDGTNFATGTYAEEFLKPYRRLREAGVELEVATPGGVRPPFDERSVAKDPAYAQEIADCVEIRQPKALESVTTAEGYDAVFIPGGHAPMQDLATSPQVGAILRSAVRSGILVAAVCHGPAALLPATAEDGTWLFKGLRMTGFSTEEEDLTPVAGKVPFDLEESMKALGGRYEQVDPRQPLVVEDGLLITGQNPASADPIAQALVRRLQAGQSR